MLLRKASFNDWSQLAQIGTQCYPPGETITEQEYQERLNLYPDHFWILEENGEVLAFANGLVTDAPGITDDMFHDPHMHKESGAWQTILGINTSPKHQKKGYASRILRQLIADAKQQGRRGCILTCKEELLGYYEKFGFCNTGVSQSVLAGQVWYDMVLRFSE